MKVVLQCECGCKDFEITGIYKYAKCKKCDRNIYIKDADFKFDFEEVKNK